MRASILCSVVSGDPPVNIRWFKDDKDILGDNTNISIVSITEFVSSLIINRLDRTFSGNYTCVANSKSGGGSVNHTSRMLVRSKPIWILKPSSQTAVAGTSVRLDCLSDGFPAPIIRWKMQRRIPSMYENNLVSSNSVLTVHSSHSSNTPTVTILSSPRIHVLENGSLIIKSVEVEDQGRYVCEASNGVGTSSTKSSTAIETSAELIVFEAPVIKPMTPSLMVKRRDRAEVSCSAVGSPPLHFSWSKNEGLLVVKANPHYSIHEEESSTSYPNSGHSRRERMTTLVLHSVTRNDSGLYSCVCNNNYGTDRAVVKVIVQEPPDSPTEVNFLEVNSRSVSLSWVVAFNGNSPVTGYEVVHKRDQGKLSECTAKDTMMMRIHHRHPFRYRERFIRMRRIREDKREWVSISFSCCFHFIKPCPAVFLFLLLSVLLFLCVLFFE